jgi:hypothetical protein
MNYTPDNWVVLKIDLINGKSLYKVLASWSGSYYNGDAWRMNSGISEVKEDEKSFFFYGNSGSCYECRKTAYGLRMNTAGIWDEVRRISDRVEMMDEDTDWTKLKHECA